MYATLVKSNVHATHGRVSNKHPSCVISVRLPPPAPPEDTGQFLYVVHVPPCVSHVPAIACYGSSIGVCIIVLQCHNRLRSNSGCRPHTAAIFFGQPIGAGHGDYPDSFNVEKTLEGLLVVKRNQRTNLGQVCEHSDEEDYQR